MKKTGIIHSQISAVIAALGHGDTLTIVDAGYPIPTTTQRIDLALEPGVPAFLQTLKVVLGELFVERMILAEEIKSYSPHILAGIQELLPDVPIQYVPHTGLKQIVPSSRAVIRTAEYTPYSNVILIAGPWGFKL
jgi:D-ribose pyranase